MSPVLQGFGGKIIIQWWSEGRTSGGGAVLYIYKVGVLCVRGSRSLVLCEHVCRVCISLSLSLPDYMIFVFYQSMCTNQ